MKVLVEGHRYELPHLGSDTSCFLQFIHKERVSEIADELRIVCNGTTDEQVLEMLVDRMGYLNRKMPCRETSIVKTKLEEALHWLAHRQADRIKRGVEGTVNK